MDSVKPSSYIDPELLSIIALASGFGGLSSLNRRQRFHKKSEAPKKCLLPSCKELAEEGKCFCKREHFGEYERLRRAKKLP